MKYLITLKPLEPFMFGGQNTFGSLGEGTGSYIVKSNMFPQQTAILGMLQHEVMCHVGLLTRKRRGEWVDKELKSRVKDAVGNEKFSLTASHIQEFGAIKSISSVFLMQGDKRYIKKANTQKYSYILENQKPILKYMDRDKEKKFNEKESYSLYDYYTCLEDGLPLKKEDIFKEVKQVGNQKTAKPTYLFKKDEQPTKDDTEDAYFKKRSYTLTKGFKFAFYLDYEVPVKFRFPNSVPDATFELPKSSIISLGADRGMFRMQVTLCEASCKGLVYEGNPDELVLLSDSYIKLPIKECAEFAITTEVEMRYLERDKGKFAKSKAYYLYEKGSVFIKPKQALKDALNNKNLQNIGLNRHSQEKGA